jgi:hypothetical protein
MDRRRRHTPRVVFGGPAYASYVPARAGALGAPADAGQSDLDKEYIAKLEAKGLEIAAIGDPFADLQTTLRYNKLENERLQLLLSFKDARNDERLRLMTERASVTRDLERLGPNRGAAPPPACRE